MTRQAAQKRDLKLDTSAYIIERTAKKLKQAFQRTLKAAKAGITADQWVVLDALSKTEGMSQFEIAQQISKDAPTLTRIIDLLCKKGLAEREMNTEDRRRFNVKLTTAGRKKVEALTPIVKRFRAASWDNLSEEDMAQLARILKVIDKNICG